MYVWYRCWCSVNQLLDVLLGDMRELQEKNRVNEFRLQTIRRLGSVGALLALPALLPGIEVHNLL